MPYDGFNSDIPFPVIRKNDTITFQDDDLSMRLIALANKITRGASRALLTSFGLGINEWRIMANVRMRPGTTAQEICVSSGLDKASASRAIAALEKRALVQTQSGCVDNRRRSLHLTEAGQILHDRLFETAILREATLLDGFCPIELGQLSGFINRMLVNACRLQCDTPDTM